jgi:DNA-binding protein WhiA
MSFASETKKELTQLDLKPCCEKAELAAIIRMNGHVMHGASRTSLDITTENAAIARRIYSLVKRRFAIPAEVLVRKKMRLRKNNIYMVRIPYQVKEVLDALDLAGDGEWKPGTSLSKKLLRRHCCKRSYMRGCFLAGGSVNNPEGASYHLEISFSDPVHATEFVNLCNRFSLRAKSIERKKGFVVYLKEGEKIIEFLNLIGAHQALLRFEDVRILKGMRNQVNRLVNCETANLNKTVDAAVRQIENIRFLERTIGLDKLPPKLREVAEMRLQYPEINLKELGMKLRGKVSKSGVNHRLRKIEEWAVRVRGSK